MGKLRFVVVGTGWVAGEYLKAIAERADAEVAAVVSQNIEFAKSRLVQLGIQANVMNNYEQAIQTSDVDAVVLCSTPDLRPEQAVLAAQYGKHLVLEKPLAMDRAGLYAMSEAFEPSAASEVSSIWGTLPGTQGGPSRPTGQRPTATSGINELLPLNLWATPQGEALPCTTSPASGTGPLAVSGCRVTSNGNGCCGWWALPVVQSTPPSSPSG